MRWSPSTGSMSRDACTSRTKVGTAMAATEPTSANPMASSSGVKRRPRARERLLRGRREAIVALCHSTL